MTASIQIKASDDNTEVLAAYAQEVTGINADQTLTGLTYIDTFQRSLSFTTTVILSEEQAADLNARLGIS